MILPAGLEEFGPGFLFGLGYSTCREQVKEVWVCPKGQISVLADIPEVREPRGSWFSAGCEGTGKIPCPFSRPSLLFRKGILPIIHYQFL